MTSSPLSVFDWSMEVCVLLCFQDSFMHFILNLKMTHHAEPQEDTHLTSKMTLCWTWHSPHVESPTTSCWTSHNSCWTSHNSCWTSHNSCWTSHSPHVESHTTHIELHTTHAESPGWPHVEPPRWPYVEPHKPHVEPHTTHAESPRWPHDEANTPLILNLQDDLVLNLKTLLMVNLQDDLMLNLTLTSCWTSHSPHVESPRWPHVESNTHLMLNLTPQRFTSHHVLPVVRPWLRVRGQGKVQLRGCSHVSGWLSNTDGVHNVHAVVGWVEASGVGRDAVVAISQQTIVVSIFHYKDNTRLCISQSGKIIYGGYVLPSAVTINTYGHWTMKWVSLLFYIIIILYYYYYLIIG